MKLVYFAWVRERVGKAEETLDLPAGIATVADLVDWLKAGARNTPTRSRPPAWCARPSTGSMPSRRQHRRRV